MLQYPCPSIIRIFLSGTLLPSGPCADFEATFVYLWVGLSKGFLIDTGAVTEADRITSCENRREIVATRGKQATTLVAVHTHGHTDHRAGSPQFAGLPHVTVATFDLGTRKFFHFDRRPEDLAHFDLGERSVDVVPTPGHHCAT